jgi:predicted glycosyltransferase
VTVLSPGHRREVSHREPLLRGSGEPEGTAQMGRNGRGSDLSHGPLRFVLYSHDGLGLGHVRRNLAIASALTRVAPGSSVLLVTGSANAERLGLDAGVDIMRLPALRKFRNGRYGARRLLVPASDLRALRTGQLTAAVKAFRPHLMLVDKHPTGPGGELQPSLRALRAAGGRAVMGFRDILDDPAEVRQEWDRSGTRELIEANYDEVLVYGMPSVLDFEQAYGLCASARCRVQYAGYVVHMGRNREATVDNIPPLLLAPRRQPVVLATAGGGEDGNRLLETFIDVARRSPWQGILVAGPDVPPDRRHALRRASAEAGVSFSVFAHDLASWFREVDAVVCMGGYNTLAEALFRGTPTVCVPRVLPRTEQLIRARAFERLGLLRLLEPSALNSASLGAAVATALDSNRPQLARDALRTLDFHGAWRTAERLVDLADPVGRPASVPPVERSGRPLSAA